MNNQEIINITMQKFKERQQNKKKNIYEKPNWIKLLEEINDEITFYYDKNKIWWLWNEEKYKWEICDETDIHVEVLKKYPSTDLTNRKTKEELTNAMKIYGRSKKIKNPKPKWIQFNDKAFNIETKEIHPVSKEHFFTNPIRWSIGETTETPIMDKLITEWVGDKNLDLMYEIIAYCLYRDYPIHRIFCFTGSGRNGKSKFLGLISKFIGDENSSTTDLDLLLSRPFESFKLYKKLICQMGETNYEGLKRTAILKQLTGQDMISFEKKGKDGFTDYNYAKLMISTNGIPITHDKSDGFYRRWLIIDFPNNFPEGKDILKTIPKEEYNNLSRKCINILPKLLERGSFTNELSIEDKKRIYEEKSNPLALYIKKFMIKDYNAFVGKTDMYNKFSAWLNINGYRTINYNEFSGLMKLEYEEGQKGEDKTRSWIGLRYLTDSEYRGDSNASNASNSNFQLVSIYKNPTKNSVTSVTSVTKEGIINTIKIILPIVIQIKSVDLWNKIKDIFEISYDDFMDIINELKEKGEITEMPKDTYRVM